MKIGIVGGGTVGHATARCYMEHAEVRVFDVVSERRTHCRDAVLECDIVFICLPTPQREDSLACDTSAVEHFISGILPSERSLNLVLRSTVPIGFTRMMAQKYCLPNLVHSPEFLTARCAVADAQLPARNIIGCRDRSANLMPDGCARVLHCLYVTRFPGIQVQCMMYEESEAVKLMTNSYGASVIALWNEFYELCQKLGINFEAVRAGILSDGRISAAWSKVPGPDGDRGFGGACLPKDLANLINSYWNEKVEGGAKMLMVAMERNQFDRRKEPR